MYTQWLIHTDVRQEPTKFCKAIILQFKNKVFKKVYILPLIFHVNKGGSKSLDTIPKVIWRFASVDGIYTCAAVTAILF